MPVVPTVTTTVPTSSPRQPLLECVHVHTTLPVDGNGIERQTEHVADALMRVVGLLGGDHGFARSQLPGRPRAPRDWQTCPRWSDVRAKSFQPNIAAISRTASTSMLRTGSATVERVVVGVEPHGHGIRGSRDGMRRLQHLPGIERMEVRVVVRHALCDLLEHVAPSTLPHRSPVGFCGGAEDSANSRCNRGSISLRRRSDAS